MSIIIPFRTRYDREDNLIYEFKFMSKTGKQKDYTTEIKIDEFYDDHVIETYCDCPDTVYNKNKLCKHKKEAIELLKTFNINFVYNPEKIRKTW